VNELLTENIPFEKPVVTNPDLCIVRAAKGERPSAELAAWLDPVDPATFHQYVLPANTAVELHGHDFDEYWWFTSGTPVVTLWTPQSGTREYQLGAGDLVCLVRGMAHTLRADHPLVYYQFSSVRRLNARSGHLIVKI
jgi:mannose-6-phosphate isomerase-like protein (cupin superfamily)